MNHNIIVGKAQNMEQIQSESISLVVTSPPYPMIEMWDDIMSNQNPEIKIALEDKNGTLAYDLMHEELDKIWAEVNRVIIPGGFVCINIGDATRKINNEFALYPNHAKIINAFLKLGFSNLPNIIWRKQTNAPNKFMGSGMLPSGAYVTLEHEWILIFRKGSKRQFKTDDEKLKRKESSFFWEERNIWFSDLWDLKGVKQKVNNAITRDRSAAFPFEIPYRLINMYSLKGDTILDPFLGTGTTILAAMVTERNSIGIEIDKSFLKVVTDNINNTSVKQFNNLIYSRLEQHQNFISNRTSDISKKQIKHFNSFLNVPVMTSQETEIILSEITGIQMLSENEFLTTYKSIELAKSFIKNEPAKQLDAFEVA
jgi:DNA modification methylase